MVRSRVTSLVLSTYQKSQIFYGIFHSFFFLFFWPVIDLFLIDVKFILNSRIRDFLVILPYIPVVKCIFRWVLIVSV